MQTGAKTKPTFFLSAQTRKNKRNDRLFQGFLWGAVIFTMMVLVFIIGYVLFRGFYYNNRMQYDVADFQEEKILVDMEKQSFVYLIMNKGVRTSDITMPVLHEIFNGNEYEWANYSKQDLEIILVALNENKGVYANALDEFLAKGDKLSEYAEFVTSEEEMVKKVAETPGALGYISADSVVSLRGVKKLKLRRIVIGANPSTRELKNNRRLLYLDNENIRNVFAGRFSNWQEVDGIDLPLIQVINRAPHSYNAYFSEKFFGENFTPSSDAKFVGSSEEFFNTIKSTEGAVGLCSYNEFAEHELELIPVKRREAGLNLTLPFILKETRKSGRVGGIRDIILNTLMLIALTLAISTPLGIAAAIYFVEYAKQGRIITILRLGTETLAGIPSIIFGLFGYLVFVQMLGFQMGLLSGSLTMTIMILPTIVRTSEEALKTVPQSFREGSLALGATKWQTILRVVVPAASPGILTGIILGLGRTIGETAALLFTMGSGYKLFRSFSSSGRSLALHLYFLFSEGISEDRSFATGAILIAVILLINYATTRLLKRMNKLAGRK